MSYTLCTSGAIIMKAGANANSTAVLSDAILSQFCDDAEAFIGLISRYDWVTNYASLTAEKKKILTAIASNLAAVNLIAYDMSGYSGREEAESMINVLWTQADAGINLIKEQPKKDYVKQ